MMRTLIAIIVLVASGAGIILYAAPRYQHARELQTRVVELEDAFNKATQLRAIRQDLETRYNAFSDTELDTLSKMLPTYVDNVRLATIDINNLALQYGLILKDVSTSESEIVVANPDEVASPVGTLDIEFTLTGSYTSFVSFIEHLERSMRIIDVKSVTFNVNQFALQKTPLDRYDYKVVVSTYWLRSE